jgi:alpha-L-arabinofuranosidase
MEICRAAGAEPSLTASLGADDPQEAADWVAYVRERHGAADPQIRLVASGGDAFTLPRWNEEVIRGIAACGLFLEEQILRIEETTERLIGRPLPFAFDEWNILGPLRRFTDPYRCLREAIGVAGILHAFHHVLRMYRRLTGTMRVRTETACPAVDVPALLNLPPRKAVPLLDVSATREEDRLTIFVINRDATDPHAARVEVAGVRSPGRARVHSIAADGYSAENTLDDPEAVAERVSEIEWRGSFRFPPHSVTAIVLEP